MESCTLMQIRYVYHLVSNCTIHVAGMRSFLRDTVSRCRELGYVETIQGRRRYLPAIKDTNPHAKAHVGELDMLKVLSLKDTEL